MEGSSSEDSSEYKDWEIPTSSITKLKACGYLTIDEAGELILKPEYAEKAKEMLRQGDLNDEHSPCCSTSPSINDGNNVERGMVSRAINRNYDEMMVAQFMISMPAENVATPHLQQSTIGRGRLDSLRDNVNMTQSSPGKPKKSSAKGAAKPKKPTKKELQALLADKERELNIATSIPPLSSSGPRPALPKGLKLPPTLKMEYGKKEDFDNLASFSPSSSPGPQITGSRGLKLPSVLQTVNIDHGRKEELYNAISCSTLSLGQGPRAAGPSELKLPRTPNANVTAPSGTNAQLRMNFSSPKSVIANFQNETLFHKQSLIRRVSAPGTVSSTCIINSSESFSQPVSELIPVSRSISEEASIQHKIMNDSSIPNAHLANVISKTVVEPNNSLHNDLRISPIVSTSSYRPATLQYTTGKIQHGSIGSLNQGGVVTSIVLNGATASISQNLANTLQSPQIVVANPGLRNPWQQSNGKIYKTSQSVEVARAAASVEHKLSEYRQQYIVMATGTAGQTGGGKGKKKKAHLDDITSPQSPKDVSNSDNESFKPSSVVFGTPQSIVTDGQPIVGESSPRVKAPHCPKFLPGKLALCLNCGGGSKDIARCHPCGKDLPTDVRLVDDVRPKEMRSLESRPIFIQSRNASVPVIIKKIVTTSSGEMPSIPTTSIIGPVRKDLARSSVKKRKVHEEPECLTLSSDDEGEKNQPPPRQVVEDNFEIPEFDVGKLNEGETLVEFWAGCMQVIKIGLVNSKVSEKLQNIFIVESGFHITVESTDAETNNIWIPKEHITRIEYNMGGKFKLLAIYVAPPMANWIRNRLKISDKMFDVNSSAGALKRILIIVDHIKTNTEDCIQRLVKHYSGVLVDGVDTQAILASYAKLDKNNDETIEKNNEVPLPSEEEFRFVPLDLSKTLFTYPPAPEKGGISITGEDFMCLEDEQFLNDSMIDFYLKYLQMTKLSADERGKIHIFSTYFYKRLTHRPTSKRRPAFEDDPNLTPEEKRHCRVKSWTKNVDIFEKDYLLVPICEKSHWFLAIICFPYLQGPVLSKDNTPIELPSTPRKRRKTPVSEASSMKSFKIGSTTIIPIKLPMSEEVKAAALSLNDDSDRDEAESDSELEETAVNSDENMLEKRDLESKTEPCIQSSQNSTGTTEEVKKDEIAEPKTVEVTAGTIDVSPVDGEPVKQPCILVFDSLEGPSRGKIVATLREYLKVEFKVKKKEDRPFKDFVKGVMLKVPQQTNYSDCGLYVLQYAESFFESNPLKDFRTPIPSMRNWFDPMVVIRKREDLGNLIHDLTEEQNPGLSDSLPDIKFPTIDGELVHLDEDYYEEEEEEEMSDEYDHEEVYYSDDSARTQSFDVITPAWRNKSAEENFDHEEDGVDQEIWEPEEEDPHKVEVAEIGGELEVDSEEHFKDNDVLTSEEGMVNNKQFDRLVATDPNFKITCVEASSDISEEEESIPNLSTMNSVDAEPQMVSGAVLKLKNLVEIEKRKTNESDNDNSSKRQKLVEYGDSCDSDSK